MKKWITIVAVVVVLSVSLKTTAFEDGFTDEQVALAKICLHEAGWHHFYNDCVAIHQVLTWRTKYVFKKGMLYTMEQYSTKVFDKDRTDHRGFIPHLTASLEQPHNWPSNLKWDTNYKYKWKRVLKTAKHIALRSPRGCSHTPRHWGNLDDLNSSKRRWHDKISSGEWAITDCGDTKNYFLHKVRKE